MTSNLTQLDVLKCKMELDQCDDVFYNPDHRVILPDNPLNMDVWLVGIQNGIVILLATQLYRLLCFCNGTHSRNLVVDLVKDYNMEKGEVEYKTPEEGMLYNCDKF